MDFNDHIWQFDRIWAIIAMKNYALLKKIQLIKTLYGLLRPYMVT